MPTRSYQTFGTSISLHCVMGETLDEAILRIKRDNENLLFMDFKILEESL